MDENLEIVTTIQLNKGVSIYPIYQFIQLLCGISVQCTEQKKSLSIQNEGSNLYQNRINR